MNVLLEKHVLTMPWTLPILALQAFSAKKEPEIQIQHSQTLMETTGLVLLVTTVLLKLVTQSHVLLASFSPTTAQEVKTNAFLAWLDSIAVRPVFLILMDPVSKATTVHQGQPLPFRINAMLDITALEPQDSRKYVRMGITKTKKVLISA